MYLHTERYVFAGVNGIRGVLNPVVSREAEELHNRKHTRGALF